MKMSTTYLHWLGKMKKKKVKKCVFMSFKLNILFVFLPKRCPEEMSYCQQILVHIIY